MGFNISAPKTIAMIINRDDRRAKITRGNTTIEQVNKFKFLGRLFDNFADTIQK